MPWAYQVTFHALIILVLVDDLIECRLQADHLLGGIGYYGYLDSDPRLSYCGKTSVPILQKFAHNLYLNCISPGIGVEIEVVRRFRDAF